MGSPRPQVLLFDATTRRSQAVHDNLLERGFDSSTVVSGGLDPDLPIKSISAALVVVDQDEPTGQPDIRAVLEQLSSRSIATLVWGACHGLASSDLLQSLPADASVDEVVGRMATMAQLAPVLRRMNTELSRLQRLGQQLNRHFEEIDKEMRMAGKLQREFMPRNLPQLARVRFAQLYRPAAWVSGDIYDAIRVDDEHVAIFVADAMGHGTAAGLMTMFLRKLLIPRLATSEGFALAAPVQVLNELHHGLARQELPNAQFVTAAYGLLNTRTLAFRLARAGHPYPLWINAAGELREIVAEGGLLGVGDIPPECVECTVQLAPGDKIIFYTDGIEEDFVVADEAPASAERYRPKLRDYARLDLDTLIATVAHDLDHQEGSLNPADDVTLVGLQIARDG